MKPTTFLERLTNLALVVLILALYLWVASLDSRDVSDFGETSAPISEAARAALSEPLTRADWEVAK